MKLYIIEKLSLFTSVLRKSSRRRYKISLLFLINSSLLKTLFLLFQLLCLPTIYIFYFHLFSSTIFNRKGQRKGQVDIRKGFASLQTLEFTGGDKRDRTVGLLHAMQALSQLSYTPTLLSGH